MNRPIETAEHLLHITNCHDYDLPIFRRNTDRQPMAGRKGIREEPSGLSEYLARDLCAGHSSSEQRTVIGWFFNDTAGILRQRTEKMKESVRLAGIIRESITDGPGIRFALFTQGCPHRCHGCHNPQSWDFAGGYECSIERILEEIDKDPLLKGVTFSGGEPFSQPGPLAALAEAIRGRGLDLMLYSGYTFEQLFERAQKDESVGRLLHLGDYLVDGPFVLAQRDLTLHFRGSRNQRILDLPASLRAGRAVLAEALYERTKG